MALTVTEVSNCFVCTGGTGSVTTKSQRISGIRFVPALADDELELTESSTGNTFFYDKASAAYPQESRIEIPVKGVYIKTLTAGTVYIYVR